MKSLMAAMILLALSYSVYGQSYSSHSGFSFSDTLQTATGVVVAAALDGAGADNGSEVSARAELRAVRVLKGTLTPGDTIRVAWRYAPMPLEPPAASAKLPAVHALWFLRANTGGAWEALPAAMPAGFGGVFIEVPAGAPAIPEGSTLESRIAAEVGAAAQDLFASRPGDFAPHRPEAPKNGVIAQWVQTRMRLDSLLTILTGLPPASTAEVYRSFSASPEPNLRLLGLAARIGAGDSAAIFDLEREIPSLASAYTATRATQPLMGMDLSANRAAAHALGRIALGDVSIPGLEGVFAMKVTATHSPEFLPYLMVMLESPDPSVRGSALMAFCNLLGSAASPGMAPYCPNSAPMTDPAQEQRDIAFWTDWWSAHREEIARTAALPMVRTPTRYNVAPNSVPAAREMPVEYRFESLLGLVQSGATHYHNETGAIVEGAPPSPDPVAARLGPSDREIWSQVVRTVSAKLDANRQRAGDAINAARLRGTAPPDGAMRAIEDDRRSILLTTLEELPDRLSPEGWKSVQDMMSGIHGGFMSSPVPQP